MYTKSNYMLVCTYINLHYLYTQIIRNTAFIHSNYTKYSYILDLYLKYKFIKHVIIQYVLSQSKYETLP